MKRNETKQLVIDETKRNETIGNRQKETKRNKTSTVTGEITGVPSSRYEFVNFLTRESVLRYKQPLRL